MSAQFSVRITVRNYEIDFMGHVNHAVYHQYGEHARSEHLLAAGFSLAEQRVDHVGVVLLESRIRYLRELTLGDEVEVTSDVEFGEGKTFLIEHTILRGETRCAEISCVLGMLDTQARRLLPDPRGLLQSLAPNLTLLGA